MRILIATGVFSPSVGGIEQVSETLAQGLFGIGCDVTLLTAEPGPDPKDQLRPFRVTRTKNLLLQTKLILAADVTILMGPITHIALLCAALRRPFIVSHHIAPPTSRLRDRLRWSAKAIFIRMGHQCACSEALAERIPLRNVAIVPNPLRWDFDTVPFGRSAHKDFIFCGRLVSGKGVELLLRAFKILTVRGSMLSLTIAGDGPEKERLLRLSANLGLAERVMFRGNLVGSELMSEYQMHKVLVVPSTGYEAFGMVALEGLACGCEVVVTKCGGLPAAVGRCGYITLPTADELAESMQSALTNFGRLEGSEDAEILRKRELIRRHLEKHQPEAFSRHLLSLLK